MALDLYVRKDIENVLRALAAAAQMAEMANAAQVIGREDTTPDGAECAPDFHQGYRAALVSVGLAFGINPWEISTTNA